MIVRHVNYPKSNTWGFGYKTLKNRKQVHGLFVQFYLVRMFVMILEAILCLILETSDMQYVNIKD